MLSEVQSSESMVYTEKCSSITQLKIKKTNKINDYNKIFVNHLTFSIFLAYRKIMVLILNPYVRVQHVLS